eukprot:GFYU01004007.1.p1 GENE.GFYU01004007.1~~GFYU01004007.1.p1  ORF type:complete len:358 (-),score=91.87 GFYU01004007.1:134-1177(-)
MSGANHRIQSICEHLMPRASLTSALTSANQIQATLKVHPEVAAALRNKGPVVALESTIISHGMPYPQNVQTAKEVEDIIRQGGAVPATIAIINGVINVGLDNESLELLGKLGAKAHKCSRRDIAKVVAMGETGATTVSGTMIIAHMAGIQVFVTGGIGGVHREGETTMDVSADLTELGRTPVAVVCAGAKSLLDIGRTLEYLETQGVTVVGYGTDDFPAFFAPTSGYQASCRFDCPFMLAKMIHANAELQLGSGTVIGVPIPKEEAADGAVVEKAIEVAVREAKEKNVTGREVTPFLLARVNELTKGASLKSNIALVKNNARVGAQIAASLSKIRNNVVISGHPKTS